MQINIIGIIGLDVKPIEVFAQIKQAQNGEDIEFIIDSDGGEVEAGFEIAKMIENYNGNTIAHGHLVASIANIIYLSCKERKANSNSKFLIHPVTVSGHIVADANDLENIKQEILAIEEQILDYYARKTTTPKDEIRPFFGKQTWFDGQTAKHLGFATSYENLNTHNNLNMSKMLENLKKMFNSDAPPAADTAPAAEAPPAANAEMISREEFDALVLRIAAIEAAMEGMSGVTEDSIANALMNKYNAEVAKANATTKVNVSTPPQNTTKKW